MVHLLLIWSKANGGVWKITTWWQYPDKSWSNGIDKEVIKSVNVLTENLQYKPGLLRSIHQILSIKTISCELNMIGVSGRRQSLYTSRPWDLTLKLNCTKHVWKESERKNPWLEPAASNLQLSAPTALFNNWSYRPIPKGGSDEPPSKSKGPLFWNKRSTFQNYKAHLCWRVHNLPTLIYPCNLFSLFSLNKTLGTFLQQCQLTSTRS